MRATETTSLLPSPPSSPPDQLGAYTRIAGGLDPARPSSLDPWTLRFSPPSAEVEFRAQHALHVKELAGFALPLLVVIYAAILVKEVNDGARIWLLAWSLGHLPASLLLRWLQARADREEYMAEGLSQSGQALNVAVARRLPIRLLDWAAFSLPVLSQLLLTLRTRLFRWGNSNGLLDWGDNHSSTSLIDPLDDRLGGGAPAFGRILGNVFFANLQLRINCTDPAILLLAVALTAALHTFQEPISLAPHRESLMVYKGVLGGQVGGYFMERALRLGYLRQQQTSRTPCAAATTTSTPFSAAAIRHWTPPDTRMHVLTLSFGSAALESKYRQHLFQYVSHVWLECLWATDTVVQLVDVVGGQVKPLQALVLVTSQNMVHLSRGLVRCRGDRAEDVERFRLAVLAYDVLLLLAKVAWPSLMGPDGDEAMATTLEAWFFLQPFILRLVGPRVPFCWILSATAIAVTHFVPAFTSSGGHSLEGSGLHGLRDAVVAAEIAAYLFDWNLRSRFVRRIDLGHVSSGDMCIAVQ